MLHDSDDRDWALLTRYLSGDLSPAEAQAVERWFEADPGHRALLDELRAVWDAAGGETAGWDTERAIAGLRAQAEPAAKRRPAARARGGRRGAPSFVLPRRRPWVAVAAGIAAAIVGVVLVRELPDSVRAPAPAVASLPVTDIATKRGQQADVRLPDGTRVTLGAASRLSYARDFAERERVVTLDGEAYFDVVHNDAQPFRVRTAHGIAEDIGTAFVVRAHGEAPLQIVVSEGAVVLRPTLADTASPDSLLLTRGQLGRLLPSGELIFRSKVDPDAYLAWMRGELVFENTPLTDVAAELSRWYNADVGVADTALASRHFSGRFSRRTLDEAIQLIASVTDVSVRRVGAGWVFE